MYGENHPSTMNSLINLATVHKDIHEYEIAIPLYERAMEGRKVLEGENSVSYFMTMAMVAGAYREIGKFDICEKYLKDSYMRIASEFGEENVQAAIILNSMGLMYKKQKKFERSLDAYQRALKVRVESLGEDHPDCLATRHNIAELYIEWAKPEKAQEYLTKNLEMMEKRNSEEKQNAKE